MKIWMILTASALPLAACNNSPEIDETNASVGDVAAKVRAASGDEGFVRPGEWSSKVTIEEMTVPGVPEEIARNMRTAMAERGASDFKSCLTAEDVKQPKGKFFTGNDQCRYDRFKMGDGQIDAVMRCGGGEGREQVMTMAGTYSPERYEMRMTMTGSGGPQAAAGEGMTMKMRVESTRVGECSAETSTAAN